MQIKKIFLKNMKKYTLIILPFIGIFVVIGFTVAYFYDNINRSLSMTSGVVKLNVKLLVEQDPYGNDLDYEHNMLPGNIPNWLPGDVTTVEWTVSNNGNKSIYTRSFLEVAWNEELREDKIIYLYNANMTDDDIRDDILNNNAGNAINMGSDDSEFQIDSFTLHGYQYLTFGNILDGTGNAAEHGDAKSPYEEELPVDKTKQTFRYKLAFSPNASKDYQNKKINLNVVSEGLQYRNNSGVAVLNEFWPIEAINPLHYCALSQYKNNFFCKIIYNNGGTSILSKGSPLFSSTAVTNEGMYITLDNYGKSYYFRGASDNNNVMFGGFLWKIIRVTGSGEVRLIYNGTESYFNTNSTIPVTGTNTAIATINYNSTVNDNRYFGYMYGSSCTDYSTCMANNINSKVKDTVDSWYEKNIASKSNLLNEKIVDSIYCNDRSTSNFTTATGNTLFRGYNQLITNKNPTLECSSIGDRFTTSSANGNGVLTYPVGLITADEVSFAGGIYGMNNSSYYLYNALNNWTMTPARFVSSASRNFYLNTAGQLAEASNATAYYYRPVITLSKDVKITRGDGTASNPYQIYTTNEGSLRLKDTKDKVGNNWKISNGNTAKTNNFELIPAKTVKVPDQTGAYLFDSATMDLVEVPYDKTSQQLSYSVWFYATTDGTSGGRDMVTKYYGSVDPYASWGVQWMNGQKLGFLVDNNGYKNTVINQVIPLNEWHNITITIDTISVKAYVDGVYVTSYTRTNGVNMRYDTSKSIFLGGFPGITNETERFNGSLQDFKLYERVLTATEVLELYQSRHVQGVNEDSLTVAEPTYDPGLYFDANYNTNIEYPLVGEPQTLSYTTWVTPTESTAHNREIVGKYYNATIPSFGLYYNSGYFSMTIDNSGSKATKLNKVVSVGEKANITVVITPTQMLGYINGVLTGTYTRTTLMKYASNYNLTLGAYTAGTLTATRNFTGYMHYFKLYDKELSATEVMNLYQSGY